MGNRRAMQFVAALAIAGALGCTREVAAGLDETEANRGVVALSRAGIDAEKVADPSADNRFRLVVARDDATAAIAVLSGEEVPRARPPAAKESSLISSPDEGHAARIAATAAQVERTLASIDGVLDARVLLDIPLVDPFAAALAPSNAGASALPHATASILVRHRGNAPPIAPDEIRKLVAGAVSGLAVADVAVVLVSVPAPSTGADRPLAYLGPIAVARSSLSTLRAFAIGALALIGALGSVILLLTMRLRRQKEVGPVATS